LSKIRRVYGKSSLSGRVNKRVSQKFSKYKKGIEKYKNTNISTTGQETGERKPKN